MKSPIFSTLEIVKLYGVEYHWKSTHGLPYHCDDHAYVIGSESLDQTQTHDTPETRGG